MKTRKTTQPATTKGPRQDYVGTRPSHASVGTPSGLRLGLHPPSGFLLSGGRPMPSGRMPARETLTGFMPVALLARTVSCRTHSMARSTTWRLSPWRGGPTCDAPATNAPTRMAREEETR